MSILCNKPHPCALPRGHFGPCIERPTREEAERSMFPSTAEAYSSSPAGCRSCGGSGCGSCHNPRM